MRKVVLAVAVFFAAWSVGAFADGVGVVDMKAIFSTSPKVKAIKAELTKQFNPEKTKLESMGQALQGDITKYQKNKAVMSQADLKTLQDNITKQESDFRDAQTKSRRVLPSVRRQQEQHRRCRLDQTRE